MRQIPPLQLRKNLGTLTLATKYWPFHDLSHRHSKYTPLQKHMISILRTTAIFIMLWGETVMKNLS